jgi:uncharacterized protein YjbJ (UPF0337 family)
VTGKHENQNERPDQRQFPRSEGNNQRGGRKVTSDPNLRAEGKAEKNAGKVQQRIGDAKEVVANLTGELAELKKVG